MSGQIFIQPAVKEKLRSNLSLRTPFYYGQFVWFQKCQKSYVPYLCNKDTSVKRTLGSVPLVFVIKRFDCIVKSIVLIPSPRKSA